MLIPVILFAQNGWQLDKPHSFIEFEVEHIVVLKKVEKMNGSYTLGVTKGKFKEFNISLKTVREDFLKTKIEAKIDVNSLDTGNELRDAHLESESFFYAKEYPEITFNSKSIDLYGKDIYKITGELTIRGVTKEVELDVDFNSKSKNFANSEYMSISINGMLNRYDFGMDWNVVMEGGGFRVSSNVKFNIQANFIRE
jgi:polyisoprenoid-binding protein YceI